MSRKQYVPLARMMGDGLAIVALSGGEQARSEFYSEMYCPLVSMLAADNPRFDRSRFGFAVEQAYAEAARECGRAVQS